MPASSLTAPAAVTAQQAYHAISTEPITTAEIYEPMVSTAFATSSFGLSLFGFLAGSNPVSAGFFIAALLPGLRHGTELYTNWIPKLAWKLPIGELRRLLTGIPNVKRGIDGWQGDSRHSNHFDERLSNALIGLFQLKAFSSHADFDLGGSGQYSAAMHKAGIYDSQGYDFSPTSVFEVAALNPVTLQTPTSRTYDLVTSFEVLSKTKPGEESDFILKLINATNSGGMIAMSCAIPNQAGPNSNCLESQKVMTIFERNGCRYNEEATLKLRRAANPMHPWLKRDILAFDKL